MTHEERRRAREILKEVEKLIRTGGVCGFKCCKCPLPKWYELHNMNFNSGVCSLFGNRVEHLKMARNELIEILIHEALFGDDEC